MFEGRISIITLGVKDLQRSVNFYHEGLGFELARQLDNWAIFLTAGSRFALYPRDMLAEDISEDYSAQGAGFGGITLAHNTRSKEAVDSAIQQAIAAGGTLLKTPRAASWGGYSGYFADLDGYPWEVAWSESWIIDEEGILWGGSLGNPPGPPQAK